MKISGAAALAVLLGVATANAGEVGDQLPQSLYDGTLGDLVQSAPAACEAEDSEACFALGLHGLITAYENFARALYRHGATTPNSPAMGMLLGMGLDTPIGPANPDPEPLNYGQFRDLLEEFSAALDKSAGVMKRAGEGAPFVITIDPLRVRVDLDGDGSADEDETLGTFLAGLGAFTDIPAPDGPPPGGKTKTTAPDPTADTSIGFDNADAIWFAGYATVVGTPVELTLAHDFSEFFDAYFHRIFPRAGLPMEDYSRGLGTLIMDADSDAFIADIVAAVHTADFPVEDPERLAGILTRLSSITALSRQNWEMILAETDDNRELVPSPGQTSFVPGEAVTAEIVDAWLATLDQLDRIIAGDLLIPHWRFEKGFNLKTFFETATETDLVLLFTGQGALGFLDDGPVADAESFAELNRAMGENWPMFALWFN